MANSTSKDTFYFSLEKCTKLFGISFLKKNFFKWKTSMPFSSSYNLPFFILLVSLMQVTIYIVADENMKRVLMYDARKKKELWRFVTYMLIHVDFTHLLLNLIIQVLLGIPVEVEQGHSQCAGIYFGGGLAGSIGASTFASFSLMAGASSGIYALLISQVPNIILNSDIIKYLNYRIFAITTLTISDGIYIFYHVYFCNNENPQIGWVAHAFGAIFGLILGFLLFKGNSKLKKPFQAVAFILLFVFVIAVNYNFLKAPLILLGVLS